MQYTIVGFSQNSGFRSFRFEGVGPDGKRIGFTVEADLALARRYGIRLQELPLLCRGLLERQVEGEQKNAVTFTEEKMSLYASSCAAERDAAAQRKRPVRRPPSENTGNAWRAPQPRP